MPYAHYWTTCPAWSLKQDSLWIYRLWLENLITSDLEAKTLHLRATIGILDLLGENWSFEKLKRAEELTEILRVAEEKQPIPEMLEPLLPQKHHKIYTLFFHFHYIFELLWTSWGLHLWHSFSSFYQISWYCNIRCTY